MNRRGAIVLVTTSFPISGDGSEAAGSFVSDLAEELAKHVPVRVVAPGRDSGQDRWAGAVDVFRYAAPGRPLSALKPWRLEDLATIRRVLASGYDATARALSVAPTAHILALWALPSGHWARRASASNGIPYSVWTLGSDIWALGKIPLVRGYLRRVLRDAQYCFSDGIGLAEDTRAIGGRPVEFLPSSRRIGSRRLSPARKSPPYRLLYLGRWHPNKGTDLLVEALQGLDDAAWERIESVDIQGGGPLEVALRHEVASLRGQGRPVRLGGFLPKEAAEAAILDADYLLIPSRIESIPVVLSDALKLRCPVICTPVGDLPGIVSKHQVGVIAAGVDARAIRDAIREAVLGERQIDERALDEAAEVFDMERIASRITCLAGSVQE